MLSLTKFCILKVFRSWVLQFLSRKYTFRIAISSWWVDSLIVMKCPIFFFFLVVFHVLKSVVLCSEKATAPHSSALAWRIPGTGEPGGLPSTGSHRVGHGWGDSAAAAAVLCWHRHCSFRVLQFPLCLSHPLTFSLSAPLCLKCIFSLLLTY